MSPLEFDSINDDEPTIRMPRIANPQPTKCLFSNTILINIFENIAVVHNGGTLEHLIGRTGDEAEPHVLEHGGARIGHGRNDEDPGFMRGFALL